MKFYFVTGDRVILSADEHNRDDSLLNESLDLTEFLLPRTPTLSKSPSFRQKTIFEKSTIDDSGYDLENKEFNHQSTTTEVNSSISDNLSPGDQHFKVNSPAKILNNSDECQMKIDESIDYSDEFYGK